jgi:hypothetical protein
VANINKKVIGFFSREEAREKPWARKKSPRFEEPGAEGAWR